MREWTEQHHNYEMNDRQNGMIPQLQDEWQNERNNTTITRCMTEWTEQYHNYEMNDRQNWMIPQLQDEWQNERNNTTITWCMMEWTEWYRDEWQNYESASSNGSIYLPLAAFWDCPDRCDQHYQCLGDKSVS